MGRLMAADVIVLAAPLYFWNVPAQTKLLIDRSECQWARKHVLDAPLAGMPSGSHSRRGVFISAAGRPKADFRGATLTVEEFFCVWEAAYWADLLYSDVDPKGAIEAHPQALREAFELGQKSVTEGQGE
jgi:multimeric flavodoxin WrbA